MPLYEIDGNNLRRHDSARFAALGIYERKDLQQLLRDDIEVLSTDLLVKVRQKVTMQERRSSDGRDWTRVGNRPCQAATPARMERPIRRTAWCVVMTSAI